MKQFLAIAGILAATSLFVPAASAQTSIHDEIALTRAQIQADRQTLVTASLKLTDDESKVFWPLYREYRAEMDKPMDRMWTLVTTYADKWGAMSDADATKILDEWLSIEKQQVETRQKWAKKMAKTLPGVTVARFFQIDNKIDTMLRLDAAAQIPLVVKQ